MPLVIISPVATPVAPDNWKDPTVLKLSGGIIFK